MYKQGHLLLNEDFLGYGSVFIDKFSNMTRHYEAGLNVFSKYYVEKHWDLLTDVFI